MTSFIDSIFSISTGISAYVALRQSDIPFQGQAFSCYASAIQIMQRQWMSSDRFASTRTGPAVELLLFYISQCVLQQSTDVHVLSLLECGTGEGASRACVSEPPSPAAAIRCRRRHTLSKPPAVECQPTCYLFDVDLHVEIVAKISWNTIGKILPSNQ